MKEKILAAFMTTIILISSTMGPVLASMPPSKDEHDYENSYLNSIEDKNNKDKPIIYDELDIDNKPMEEFDEESDINSDILMDSSEGEDQNDELEEEVDQKVDIIEKTEVAKLYQDSSYFEESKVYLDIRITGQMPENAIIKAYEIENLKDIEGEDIILSFAFEIFDGENQVYEKNPQDTYKISLRSSDFDHGNIKVYEKNSTDISFTKVEDFEKNLDEVKLVSSKNVFIISKEKKEKADLEARELFDNKNIKENDNRNIEEKLSNTGTYKESLEKLKKKDNSEDAQSISPEDIKNLRENFLDAIRRKEELDDNIKEQNPLIKDKKESLDSIGIEKEKDFIKDKKRLNHQQILADIYLDASYKQRANDSTKIKLNGLLPVGAKVKAYPVEIKIEGQEVLAAYDITVFDKDSKEYKVGPDNNIRVKITNKKIKKAKKVDVYHKENEFAPEERIENNTKTDDTVAFKADSFSIYAVTNPEAKNIKFVFFYQDKDGKNIIWDVQNIRNGEKLIQPELPIFSHDGKFEGWYYYDYGNKDKAEKDRFGEKFDFDKAVKVDENSDDVIYLKGKYPDVLIINFIDKKKYEKDDGTFGYVDEILSTKEIPAGGTIPSDDIPVIPQDSKTVFSHWSLQAGGKEAFDFSTKITKDFIKSHQQGKNYGELNLYAVYKQALTVSFDSQGGSHVNRQIVYSGDKIAFSDLTKPVRPGYEFKYWSESPNGPAFNKDTIISSNIKLYAVYAPQQVKYTVNHWMENANDDGYSILKTEIKTGQAGSLTNSDSSTYMIPSKEQNNRYIIYDHADPQKLINGNDSTEINLYYNRKTFVFRIYEGIATDVVKVKLKWGEQTQPYLDQALKKLGNNYTFKENNLLGKVISTGPEMPKNDYTLLAWREGSNDFNVRFIDLDTNELIRLDQKTSHVSPWLQRYDGGESIKGFTYQYVESPNSNSSNARLRHGNGQESDQYEIWVYYIRNKWKLTFATNGNGDDIVIKDVPYGKTLSQYRPEDYIVDISKNSEGKVFAGWYDNPDGLGNHIDFTKKTMPDNDLKVYAKWDLPKYKVIAYKQRNNPAAGTSEQMIKEGGFVDKSQLSADKPPIAQNTPGSILRWYAFINGALVEYNFSDPVTSDIYLYPVWLAPVGNELRPLSQIYRVKYRAPASNGSDIIYLDPKEYVNNAEAIIVAPNIDKKYQFPDGSIITMPIDQVFQGWVIDKESDFTTVKEKEVLNKVYQPGDIINVVGNIMFKPLFNEYKITSVTLKETGPHGEKLPDVIIEKRVHNIKLPDDIKDPRDPEDLRVNDTTILPEAKASNTEGYKFLGWSTTEDGKNGKIFAPGQKVLLTNENLPNILYGIWEEETYNLTIHNIIDGDFINPGQTISYQVLDKDGNKLVEPFELGNGESKDNLPIPYSGFKVIASSQEGSISYEAGEDKGGNIYEKKAIKNDINVTFTTLINPSPPTGVKDNIIPMVIILALTSMAFSYKIYKKIRLKGGLNE